MNQPLSHHLLTMAYQNAWANHRLAKAWLQLSPAELAAPRVSFFPSLSAQKRPGRIARGTEDGVERVVAGDRELPQLSVHDDGVRRFIALVDECYDRKVPLYLEAQVPMDSLYTEGYLEFPFRRTLSRLQEMQLQRFAEA